MTITMPSGAVYPIARSVLLASVFFLANQCVEISILGVLWKSYADVAAWDTGWYADIAAHGYDKLSAVEEPREATAAHPKADEANWAFFPLFPLAARLLQAATGLPPVAATVTAGKIFFFLAIIAFVELCRCFRPTLPPALAAAAVALNPYAFYGNAGYSESLFLLLTCLFFIQLDRGRNLAAGLAGALLTATRPVGLAAALAYAAAHSGGIRPGAKKNGESVLSGFLLIPLGIACFMLFLHARMGDALAFLHVQKAWGRTLGNPLATIIEGMQGPPVAQYLAASSLLALAAPVLLCRWKRYDMAAFSWCSILVPLATGLISIPRFIWWQAPLLLVVTSLLAWRKAWALLLPAFVAALIYLSYHWLMESNFLV